MSSVSSPKQPRKSTIGCDGMASQDVGIRASLNENASCFDNTPIRGLVPDIWTGGRISP